MKITHFVVSDNFGGVEGHICTLIKLMANKNYEFKIVCHRTVEAQFREKLTGLNIEIASLDLCPRPNLSNYSALIRTFRGFAPDVVHCHLYSATRIGAVAAKLAGAKKIIETIHTEEVWRKGLNKWLYCTFDAVLGKFFLNKYIAVSKAVSSYYTRNKWVPNSKIALIHNTTEKLNINRAKNKSFSHRIGYLGRLSEEKGLDILIESISLLVDRNQPYKLYIGGTGPLKNSLQNLVIKKGIESSVKFLGNISDIGKFFNEIDIFVLPSRFEGFSLVLLEAGMYQMPVVATNVSGNPEIIHHNKTGILVESENSEALASGIEEYNDAGKRENFSKNLEALVLTEFSQKKYVEKMESLYQSL